MSGNHLHEHTLREAAACRDGCLDIAGVALNLAAMDRLGVPLRRYRSDLARMVTAVADYRRALPRSASGGDFAACLAHVLARDMSFRGDTATYDDLQNANLMRVMDRRKGLPVALGILYIHAARGQGWLAGGLATPGHFLICVSINGTRSILDPFNAGNTVDPRQLRDLFSRAGQAMPGPDALRMLPDQDVLLRLQNNIKLRLLQDGRLAEALAVLDRMRLLAPDRAVLLFESGIVNAQAGHLGIASCQLKHFLEQNSATEPQRVKAALLLQQVQNRLN